MTMATMLGINEYLITDDLTILLGLIAATIFLLRSLYKPAPLVHPVLLGRQSDVTRVRHPGESAIYRNYGTGMMGRFPLRPSKEIHLLSDLVSSDIPKTLWSSKINNAQIQQRVSAFGSGLTSAVSLVPNESTVLILLNDSVEFLIADLTLAALSVQSATLSSTNLLPTFLKQHPPTAIITEALFLPTLLGQLDQSIPCNIVVVGNFGGIDISSLIRILSWSNLEKQGSATKMTSSAPSAGDVFTVAYYGTSTGQLRGVQLTHQNITAGVAAIRSLVPISNVISSLDTIVSAHSLGTPYGRTIAYTALYESTSFATLESAKLYGLSETPKIDLSDILSIRTYPIPSPTILFVKPDHLRGLTDSILAHAKKSPVLNTFAWRHKLAALNEGFITKEGLWDRVVFDAARAEVMGDIAGTLRTVVVGGGLLLTSLLVPARIALSIPLVHAYTHQAVAGPVLASHPLDLQAFSPIEGDPFSEVAHVGPASVNIEAKLVGVNDQKIEEGWDPRGELYVRGPSVGMLVSGNAKKVNEEQEETEGWIATGAMAQVFANGAFKVL